MATLLGLLTFGAAAAPAAAADLTTPGCVIDGVLTAVTIDDEILGDFEGSWLPLHDSLGEVIDHSQPVGTFNDVPPICVVPVIDGEVVSSEAQWAWCLQIFNHVCSESPLEPTAYDEIIDADQAALVVWRLKVFEEAGSTTTTSLIHTQFDIWCISDDYAMVGTPFWGAPDEVVDCAGYREWLYDAVLPNLAMVDDTLEVIGPDSPVAPGEPQIFAVTTSLTEVVLTVVDADDVDLCPDETGATLVGDLLTISVPGQTVHLCASRATAGSVELTARSVLNWSRPAHVITAMLEAADSGGCQVFFTDVIESSLLEDSASAVFASASGGQQQLAVSGSGLPGLLPVLALLLSGTALAALGARRAHDQRG